MTTTNDKASRNNGRVRARNEGVRRMKAIFFWIIAVFILVCFGVVGRIDYESELAMADMRIENSSGPPRWRRRRWRDE